MRQLRQKMFRIFALVALFAAPMAQAEVRLVMFDQPGCVYCLRWTSEVGDAYDRTIEGQRAPLWRIDIHEKVPASIVLARRAVYTPTFVLLDEQHQEVSRIEGYPGEAFFWGLLAVMLMQLPPETGEPNE